MANLLFAGGGLTAAALLAQLQFHGGPAETDFQSSVGLTGEVGETLKLETPNLPEMPYAPGDLSPECATPIVGMYRAPRLDPAPNPKGGARNPAYDNRR